MVDMAFMGLTSFRRMTIADDASRRWMRLGNRHPADRRPGCVPC